MNSCRENNRMKSNKWTILQIGKFESIKIDIMSMIKILGLCETKLPKTGNFWFDNFRYIHLGGTNGSCGVGIVFCKNAGLKVISKVWNLQWKNYNDLIRSRIKLHIIYITNIFAYSSRVEVKEFIWRSIICRNRITKTHKRKR